MLFNKFFAISAVSTLAAATAIPRGEDTDIQCCQEVEPAWSRDATVILSLLGIVLDDLSVIVGLNCSPITVIGSNNGACSDGSNTVNCDDNSHGGLISIGCVPVSV